MARTRFFKTGLTLSIHDGDERELSLIVGYEFTAALRGSRDEPAQSADAEIVSVRLYHPFGGSEIPVPIWLRSFVETDRDLIESLVAAAVEQERSDKAEAEERRAEELAELLREEA